MKTNRKNLLGRFEEGKAVLDYFDPERARMVWPTKGAGTLVVLRRASGMSQSSFSRALGISPRTLQQWEQGRRRPVGPALSLLRLVSMHPRLLQSLT